MKNKIKNKLPIILVLILASITYIWGLWNEATNLYYSAGVYSMGQNLHAFFYNSVDSVGFISVDKPPLGLWIQVIFTKVLGFSGMVVLLPQAIAGVLSAYFIYKMMNKRFGQTAGIISSLVLALTPIFAAVSRNNTIDGILILLLVLASEQVFKAIEKSSMKHLIFAGIFIGLGFNVKMLQAFMIVPAVYLTYLIFSKEKILKRFLSCLVSGIILLTVSFSWIAAVDLTPADSRPYVGSSSTNSALNLAVGYNGINRIIGGGGALGNIMSPSSDGMMPPPPPSDGMMPPPPPSDGPTTTQDGRTKGNRQPPSNGSNGNKQPPSSSSNGSMPSPPGRNEAGSPSFFRLFGSNTAGQISWFLVPAFLTSIFCLYLILRRKLKENTNHALLFYFTMCFIPMFMYFSFSSGLSHRYYLAMLSFVIAPLVGIGYAVLKEKNDLNKFVFPVSFAIVAIAQVYIQSLYSYWLNWLLIVAAILFIIAFAVMVIVRKKEFANKMIMTLMATLLILPAVWSFTPIIYGSNVALPITGPELAGQTKQSNKQTDLTKLIAFLKENRNGATYLATAPSSMQMGAELILQSREPVMFLGGFGGQDSPLTVDEFKEYVQTNKVRYAVVPSSGGPSKGRGNSIGSWITENGIPVNMQFDGVTVYELKAE